MSSLLAIETSSEACSIALSLGGETKSRVYHEPRRHAELLLPSIRELLSAGSVSLGALDAIAFGRGPGSFTSLRIGIGVVQGLAWGADIGVVPVSSLAALAQGVASRQGVARGQTIVTAMDARMDEVFHARYLLGASGLVELQGEEQVGSPESVRIPDQAQCVLAGNGFERYRALRRGVFGGSPVHAAEWPQAADVITLAQAWLADHEPLPAHQAQPHYIRDDVAKKTADQG